MRCIVLMIILLCTGFFGYTAAKPQLIKTKVVQVLQKDTAKVQLRQYDAFALKAYSRQPEFQYHEEGSQSTWWWDQFWEWFWGKFKPTKTKMSTGGIFLVVLKYLFLLLGLAAVVFIILKVAGVNLMAMFRGKPASAALPYSESFENIHEINFDSELDYAIVKHNYRLAVRLLYLKALKQLDDAGLIDWQTHKTNSAYINELHDSGKRNQFNLLTRQFEYIWYGEFSIDAQVFQQINAQFQNFKQGIV